MNTASKHQFYLEKSRFGSLDGLRFFCISAVLFHHAPGILELSQQYLLAGRGFLGVDFFFALSGFLISTLLLREKDRTGRISLRGFYWRRALRILPLYLLVVSAMVLIFGLVKHSPEARSLAPYYYLFLANFLVGDVPNLGPMWSLSVEEQYYVLWPLLMVLVPRRALLPCVAILIGINLVGVLNVFSIPAPEIGPLRFAMPVGYSAILMGSGLAIMLHDPRFFAALQPLVGARWSIIPWVLLLVALLWFFPRVLEGWPQFAVHLTMVWILACLVVREDHLFQPILQWKPFARIGKISYGVYLLHLVGLSIALEMAEFAGFTKGSAVHILLYLVLTYILAEISFRTFEQYFLSLRHKSLGALRKKKNGTS